MGSSTLEAARIYLSSELLKGTMLIFSREGGHFTHRGGADHRDQRALEGGDADL